MRTLSLALIGMVAGPNAAAQILPAKVPGKQPEVVWAASIPAFGAGGMARFEAMTTDELIAQLPPATQEWRTEPETGWWKETPVAAEFQRRLNAGKLTNEQIGAALKACGMLRSTPYAFEGEDYHVWLRVPYWLENTEVTAQARLEHALLASAWSAGPIVIDGTGLPFQEESETFQKIGVIPPETTHIVFDVTVTPMKASQPLWKGEITLPVQVVKRTSPQPTDSPELRQAIANLQRGSLGIVGSPDSPFGLMSGLVERPLRSPLDNCYARRAVNLLKDGKVVQTFFLRDPSEISRNDVNWQNPLDERYFSDLASRKNLERYAVRVRGLPPAGFPRWPRTQYWNGEITMPITEVLDPATPAKE
ncbi:MAG: hypothetical protein GC200_00845 [Tepidisphaera sp.]|nr:hypothetical protein [Tepidisphaera sp.]